ncbi:MAG: hypothetical protein JRJ82_02305, partial [Deltaproteobacteria bacterium]|nr:hypothetical protein [Deltaproteobacteria bacterium]
GGVIDDVKGLGYALYQSPVWDDSPPVGNPGYPIGILKLDFAGPVHPDIGMWEAVGTAYPMQMDTVIGYPDDFSTVVEDGVIAGWMYGGNENGGPMIGSELAWGSTSSTLGHDDWGIFNMLFGYDNYIQGPGPWTAAANGWGEFGRHWTSTGDRIGDMGMWITDPFTVTANSPLQANFTGELLTYSKWAEISGEVIGAWDAAANSFLGGAGGYWQNGTPLAFNGILEGDLWHKAVSYRGGWNDESGDYFWYDYWDNSNVGWFTSEQGGVKTHIDYNPDGTYEMWMDDNGTLSSGEGTWDTSQSLKDILIAQADASAPPETETYHDGPFYDVYQVGWWDALAGSFENLWTATQADPAETRIIGEFDTWNDGMSAPPVFSSDIRSYNPYDDTATIWDQSDNSQNGAYYGYVAGRALDQNTAEGGVLALGLDKDGNAHFITGPVNINTYPDSEILEGWASVFPVEVVQGTGYDAADFHPDPGGLINESMEWWGVDVHGQFLDGNDNPMGGDINITDRVSRVSRTGGVIDGEPWALGVSSIVNGGKYDEVPGGGTSDFWEVPFAYDDGMRARQGAIFSSNESDLTRGEWTTGPAGKIAGKGYSAWVNWDAAVTGISGGDIKGTFDPNSRTWQMASLWASMDTKTYNNLLATTEGQAKLALLNIPFVQIGQTTLSQGAGTVNGMQNVTMDDVKFLAFSTGGAPRAFMSPAVSGLHDGTVTAGGPSVSLSGAHGVGADFQVNRWDGVGGNWGANITGGGTYTGTGTMNGTTIQMNGAGAGTIAPAAFSGTASGTAGVAPAP